MQNLTSLVRKFDVSGYLASTSDIVALMTFEHQTQMMNWITRIGWDVRTGANADSDVDALVRYMLFEDAFPCQAGGRRIDVHANVPGARTTGQPGALAARFRFADSPVPYPLSYMIYSAPFNALPPAALEADLPALVRCVKRPSGERRDLEHPARNQTRSAFLLA